MNRGVRAMIAAAVGTAAVAAVVGSALLVLAPPIADGADLNHRPLVGLVLTLLGALILRSRPRNAIGWILLSGVTVSVASTALGYAAYAYERGWPGVAWGELLFVLLENPTLHLVTGTALLLFPEGATRRWRRVLVGLAASGTAAFWLGTFLGQAQTRFDGVVPIESVGWAGAELLFTGGFGILAAFVGGVAAIVVDLRRATGRDRQRYGWLLLGGAATAGALFAIALGDGWVDRVASLIGSVAFPAGLTVAIARHRLYDIDVVVRRTVTYAVVTATLLATYAGLVLGAASLAGGDDPPDVVVAGATLLVAALFQPLRRLVQGAVDHRFARSRYDPGVLTASFGARLRDVVQVDAVSSELAAVTGRAFAPSAASLWLATTPSGPHAEA